MRQGWVVTAISLAFSVSPEKEVHVGKAMHASGYGRLLGLSLSERCVLLTGIMGSVGEKGG